MMGWGCITNVMHEAKAAGQTVREGVMPLLKKMGLVWVWMGIMGENNAIANQSQARPDSHEREHLSDHGALFRNNNPSNNVSHGILEDCE